MGNCIEKQQLFLYTNASTITQVLIPKSDNSIYYNNSW